MKVNKPFKFETLGQLPMQDAVVGQITRDKKQRLIAVVLTERLGNHKRAEKLAMARQQLGESIVSFEGNKSLTRAFASADTPQIKATIKSSLDAGPGIQYMLAETDQPIIVLDCQDTQAFWTALKSLGVDSDTMFALAELEALKPENTSGKQVKSVGTAHELCATLSKVDAKSGQKKNRAAINAIKAAKKFKIPSFNYAEQEAVARVKFGYNPSAFFKAFYVAYKALGKSVIAVGKLTEAFGVSTVPSSKRAFMIAVHRSARKFNLRKNPNTSVDHYDKTIRDAEEASDAQIDIIFDTPPSDIRNPQAEALLEKDSVYQLNDMSFFDLNIRDGYHFLKHDQCLFEFDLVDAKGSEDKAYALARQEGNMVYLTMFMRIDGQHNHCLTKGIVELDDQMQMVNWSEVDAKTGDVVMTKNRDIMQAHGEQKPNIIPGIMAHVMSICARMNDPDYAAHVVTPTGGKVRSGKHNFPYFEYEVVEDPLRPTHIRQVTNRVSTGSRSSPVFHPVARHVRTLKRGTPDEHVIIIPAHTRGDLGRGVRARGVDASI